MKFVVVIICSLILSTFSFSMAAQSSGTIIQGTVTSASDKTTLIGANVIEVNAENRVITGTVTDLNGNYVIRLNNTENSLVFSYIGYENVVVKVGNRREIDVAMVENNILDETTVIATKKSEQGGFVIATREIGTAMQTISTEKFEGIQATSVDDLLQGRIAGLDIVANSADPGSATSMRIRGVTSINGESEPLIVLNGIPYSMDVDPNFDYANSNSEQYANMLSINPDDIAEITVLKDAAATAIWGSKGANGVIEITTKRGVTGPIKVEYTYRYTNTRQPRGRNLLTGDDYTMYIKEAYLNPRNDDNANDVAEINYDPNFPEYENFNNNTDWVKEVTQTGNIHDHYLTISGGGERATYRFAGGYLGQDGTIIGQEFSRISSRLSLDYKISDRIRVNTEISFTQSDNKRNYENLLAIAYAKMPNVSVYRQDSEGNNTNDYYNISSDSELNSDQKNLKNPVALAYLATNSVRSTRIIPRINLIYDLLSRDKSTLRLNVGASFDTNNDKTVTFLPASTSNLVWNDAGVNSAFDASSGSLNIFMDNNLLFVPKFTNTSHALTLYGSMQLTSGNSSSQSITTYGLPSGELIDASNFGYLEGIGNGRSTWNGFAYMFRGHYAFKGKYIATATVRRDGSSRFGKGNRWGTFPGVSLKWIVSDEPFMYPLKNWLNFLALRPSWGKSGNQPKYDYLHFSRYSQYGSYGGITALKPNSLRLDDLRWEVATQYNYGMEIGLFNDKIRMDFNYYTKRIKDMLFSNVAITGTSGFGSVPYINGGIMDNEGWEVVLNLNKIVKVKDFNLDFTLNLANNKNTIIELDQTLLDGYNSDFDYANGSYLTRIQEGNSFGSIYGFRFKGTYKYDDYETALNTEGTVVGANGKPLAPVAIDEYGNVVLDEKGDPKKLFFSYNNTSRRYLFRGGDAVYEDINHDGSIDELDIVYLGNANPKLNGGFGPTFRYKNFSCRMFFNFRYGNKIINNARMYSENMYGNDNQSIAVNWRWRRDGDDTDMPRALYGYGYNWLGSDRYVEDGSFIRFKYLTFNYSMPKQILKKYGLNRLSVYLTINNLYTWTKYSGVDPEVGYGSLANKGLSIDGSNTPRTKDFTLGITVGL
ncbi:MAG: SusC/RagA family TonB-linked outer membrane protein [Marinilabiliaceae bacterium]|nr:SusC/RagA family TonB-linked outer membrane protein [Marinilabiliaceae bacterium]MBN2819107.1 SusC/RagA family TonB-linked outer membrane protein [Bacteroidales bacterium]